MNIRRKLRTLCYLNDRLDDDRRSCAPVVGSARSFDLVAWCDDMQKFAESNAICNQNDFTIIAATNLCPNLALPLYRLVSGIGTLNGRDHILQHNVSQQEVIRGSREQKMKDLVFDIASEANLELETVPF